MRVCILGDFSANLDEGYKNTSHHLAHNLARNHTVVRLGVKQLHTTQFWRGFLGARPDVIHTIARPTDQSFLATYLLGRFWPRARTVVSCLKAERFFADGKPDRRQRLLLRIARPDLVLVQSDAAKALFKALDCSVARLPNGVDLDRFHPVGAECKRALREKYGIDGTRPVVLHVGHLEQARNLTALHPLASRQIQVVVAGGLYMGLDRELIHRLESNGLQLLKGYQPCVEELYMLADCYVFPTVPGDSISMPLSVLEAMACNLPVVTTLFSGLVQAFAPGDGLTFVDDPSDIPSQVEAALRSAGACRTRDLVQRFSWQAVVDQLETYYRRLVVPGT